MATSVRQCVAESARSARRGRYFSQRGIALLFSLLLVAILGVTVAEFTTDATLEYELAANARDDMRTHFLARSGVNLARLVITVQTDILDRYRDMIGDIQLADYLPLFVGAFGGSQEDLGYMAEAIGAVNTDEFKGLGLQVGEFDMIVGSEDGKINLNCAGKPGSNEAPRRALETKLAAMLFNPAYDELFQTADAEGWRRDRETQVAALMDYLDPDSALYGTPGAPEDYGYEALKQPYQPKNGYIDSVGELKLARGVDDRFWTLFGSAFTIYGGCKENLGAIRDPNVVASIIVVAAKDPDDPVLRDPQRLWALARLVVDARNLGFAFTSTKDFAEFVKDPAGMFAGMLGADSSAAEGFDPASITGQALPDGVELDQAKLDQVAEAGPRRTYRIEVTARVRNVQKRITAIWDKDKRQQFSNRPPEPLQGAWVLWREE